MLPTTQSRTAWISTVVGILFILAVKYGEGIRQQWRTFRGNSIRLVIFFTAIIVILASLSLLYNFKPDSVDGRWVVWKITVEAVQRNPFLGIGFDQFRFQFGDFQSQYLESRFGADIPDFNSEFVTYAFNDYLQLLVENGLVGLGIFLIIIYLCFKNLNKAIGRSEAILIGSYGGMLAILVAACSSYPFEVMPIWFLFLLFLSFASTSLPKLYSIRIVKNGYTKLALGTILTLCTFVFAKEVDLLKGRVLWGKAEKLYRDGFYNDAVVVYKSAIKKLGNRPDILPDYGKTLFMAKDYTASIRILKMASEQVYDPVVFVNLGDSYAALKKFSLAAQAYNKAIKITPDKMYPRYLLAKMYLNKGDTLMAKNTAQYIVNMPVPIPSSATQLMLEKMEDIGKL